MLEIIRPLSGFRQQPISKRHCHYRSLSGSCPPDLRISLSFLNPDWSKTAPEFHSLILGTTRRHGYLIACVKAGEVQWVDSLDSVMGAISTLNDLRSVKA